jgi:hypothetical protein
MNECTQRNPRAFQEAMNRTNPAAELEKQEKQEPSIDGQIPVRSGEAPEN